MFIPPFLQRYLLLNSIRVLTITSCALVISATIRLLILNFRHYPPSPTSSLDPTLAYYPNTDIPTTFLGVFWSTLHHVSISLVLFVVILSELSLPIPLLHRLFKNTLPFLGPNWGTGFLGVLLVLVAGDGLSRGSAGGRFKEVSEWVMASTGVMNVVAGVVWKAKGKVVRGWGGWKLEVATKLEGLAEAKARAEKVVDGLPLPSSTKKKAEAEGAGLKGMLEKAAGMVSKKLDEKQQQKEARAAEKQRKAVAEKDLEKAQDTIIQPSPAAPTPQALGIFTPALPSAVVQSRTVASPASPRSSTSSNSSISRDAPFHPSPTTSNTTTRIPPPPLVLRRPPSTCTTLSRSSCYSLHPPPPLLTTFSSPNTTSLDSQPPLSPLAPPPTKPPVMKQVRFNPAPTPRHLSTSFDSQHAEVGGSKFLLIPSARVGDQGEVGLLEGERSPSVLASLKAAMLEAQAKAAASKSKKSIYLGSCRWLAEYTGSTASPPKVHTSLGDAEKREATSPPYSTDNAKGQTGEKEGNREKTEHTDEKDDKTRPYNFL